MFWTDKNGFMFCIKKKMLTVALKICAKAFFFLPVLGGEIQRVKMASIQITSGQISWSKIITSNQIICYQGEQQHVWNIDILQVGG